MLAYSTKTSLKEKIKVTNKDISRAQHSIKFALSNLRVSCNGNYYNYPLRRARVLRLYVLLALLLTNKTNNVLEATSVLAGFVAVLRICRYFSTPGDWIVLALFKTLNNSQITNITIIPFSLIKILSEHLFLVSTIVFHKMSSNQSTRIDHRPAIIHQLPAKQPRHRQIAHNDTVHYSSSANERPRPCPDYFGLLRYQLNITSRRFAL